MSQSSPRAGHAIAAAFARLEREGHVSDDWLELRYPDCRAEIEAALALDAQLGGGLSPSCVIGPYRIREFCGHGGMGRVFRATVLEDLPRIAKGRDVALKVIHPELGGNPNIHARFLREAHAGEVIDHPQVAGVLDARQVTFAGSERYLLAMAYVTGTTFRDALDAGIVFSEAMVVSCARDVARCLRAIHEVGVVHRDIKPSNLMRAEDGRVHVLDLGLAWFQDELIRLTQTGEFVGSFEYAAPEQFSRAFGEIDGRTDLFSLGMLLFELLTGRLPWDPAELEDVPGITANLGGRRLRQLNPDASPTLAAIVDRLVEPDPSSRFPDAAALLEALDAAIPTPQPVDLCAVEPTSSEGADALRRALRRCAGGRSHLLLVHGSPGRVECWIREVEDRLTRGTAAPTVLRMSYKTDPRGFGGLLPPVSDTVNSRERAAGFASEAATRRAVAYFSAMARRGLVVVILEDADTATPVERAEVVGLLRGAVDHPLLLICVLSGRGYAPWPELPGVDDLLSTVALGQPGSGPHATDIVLPALDADERAVLVTAARIGREIDIESLAGILDQSPVTVVRLLQRVSRSGEIIRWQDDACVFHSEAVRRALVGLGP